MPQNKEERTVITFDTFIRGLFALLIIGLALTGIYYLRTVLIPFFVAWLVAYLLYPVVHFFQYTCRLRSRVASVVLTLLLTVALIAGFFFLIVPPMVDEMSHLKDVAVQFVRRGEMGASIPPAVQQFVRRYIDHYNIENLLAQKDFVDAVKTAVPKLWNMLWSTASIVINVVSSLIGLLYLLFILTDYEKYANGWIHFVPGKNRPFVSRLVSDIQHGMAGYFRGQALVALSNCVMFSVGFLLIGFPMPIALGCLIGAISFVPYLQVVGFVPAALLALLKASESGDNFWCLLLLVLLVYIVVQILQDTIFTPRIMGKIMGLPPAIILISLSVWGYALGIIGLIIALPATTLIISYYRNYVNGQERNVSVQEQNTDVNERNVSVHEQNTDVNERNVSIQEQNTNVQEQNKNVQEQNVNG